MTRTLYLMRHAQAESGSTGGDFTRELTEAGRVQARAAGAQLAEAGIELALVSAATRARQTFDELGLRAPDGALVRAEYMKALYDASPATLLQRIGEIPDEVASLLVVAHAPGIPDLAANFTWAYSHREADLMQCGFPAATVVGFRVETAWSVLADFDPFDYTDPQEPKTSPVRPLES